MNDKISQDQSASRVYYFLQKDKDWQIKADTSGDNRIVKNEFRAYLLEYGDSQLWNGLKSNDGTGRHFREALITVKEYFKMTGTVLDQFVLTPEDYSKIKI